MTINGMVFQVNVTREDINNAPRQDCFDCPVARAIARTVDADRLFIEVHVMNGNVRLDLFQPGRRPIIRLPKAARQAISQLDNHQSVEPFAFRLTIPAQFREAREWSSI